MHAPITINEYSYKAKEQRSDTGTDNSQRKRHTLSKDTVSSSLKRETVSPRPEKFNKSHYNSGTRRKVHEELASSKHDQKNTLEKTITDKSKTTEKKEHNSRPIQRSIPKSTSEESGEASRERSAKNRETSSHRKLNSSKDKINSMRENIKPQTKQDSDSSPHRSSHHTKSNNEKEKDLSSKSNSNRSNRHREYVINYDDKNGTVSSICKIKPGIGPPRRKKTSKEILKENHKDNSMKNKTVDKIALRK